MPRRRLHTTVGAAPCRIGLLGLFGLLGLTGLFGLFGTGCGERNKSASEGAAPRTAPVARAEIEAGLEGIAAGETRAFGDGLTMTMHRMGVDERGADGWQRARSTEGGFEVELPVAYNDFRVEGRTEQAAPVLSHTVGGATAGQLKWSATCLAPRDAGALSDATPGPATPIEAIGEPIRAYSRTLKFSHVRDDIACVLIVEAQGDDPLPDRDAVDRFMGSFAPA